MKLFLMLAFFAMATVASAQWSTDASVNNAVSTATGSQIAPKIATDNSGGSIIVWADGRSGNSDIYAQRMSAAGVALWTANGVAISTAVDIQTNPVIIPDGNGGAIIAWEDNRSGTGSDIYAQRVNAGGVVQWTTNGVAICAAANIQGSPALTLIATGDAVIVWEDERSNGVTDSDIYAQRVNAAGVVQWTANGVVVTSAITDQFSPAIVNAFGGAIFVTWMDFFNGPTTGADIYVQRLNENGLTLMTANGVAICTAVEHQYSPQIVYAGNSEVVITWEDFRNNTDLDIYAQRMNSTGVLWTANGVPIAATTGEQSTQTIIASSNATVIAWKDKRGANFDIYAQKINSAGVIQWTANGVAVSTAADNQIEPAVVLDGSNDSYVVAWSDRRDGSNYHIYSQRVSSSGVPQWTANGIAVTTAPNGQSSPAIAYDPFNGASKVGYIIAWNDFRAGNNDIYAQRVNPNGVLCGIPANPGAITGSANILAGTLNSYSVTAALGADSYLWTLPSGWTGVSTTNSITATPNATNGTISVSTNNVCGASVSSSSLVITVTKQNQTITFNPLAAKAMGDAAFDPGATASSGLAVSYTSSNTVVATVSGNSVTIVGAGTSTITAKQAGDLLYNAAADVPQVLTVNKGNQTITFTIPGPKTLGDAPLTLTATASSGLPVTFLNTSPSTASLNGNVLTLIAAGTAVIAADQPGNANYNAAAQVSQTFCINPPKPTVTVSGVNTEAPILTSSSAFGNQWFLNDAAIASATNTTLTVTSEGVFKVKVTVGVCASVFSDSFTFVITGDGSPHHSGVSLYPNPASDRLIVTLPTTAEMKVVSIYEARGSRMDGRETNGSEVQFDIAGYAQGVYLVKVSTGASTQLIRFVKN